MRYIEVTAEAWDAVVERLHGKGYTGLVFNPCVERGLSRAYMLVEDGFLTWSQDLDFIQRIGCTETTLDKLLGKETGMVELEALNYIKNNELSVTTKFEYCEGELDLVEITTDSETYPIHKDLDKTIKVLEAIHLLESL